MWKCPSIISRCHSILSILWKHFKVITVDFIITNSHMAWKFRLLSVMCGFLVLLVCYCCYYKVSFLTNYVLLCASSKICLVAYKNLILSGKWSISLVREVDVKPSHPGSIPRRCIWVFIIKKQCGWFSYHTPLKKLWERIHLYLVWYINCY
jgi:hypothetical protein